MNTAKSLEDHEPGVLDEFIQQGDEEEIVDDYRLALLQLLTCTVEVEVHVEMLQEFGYRVPIRVRFLVAKRIARLSFVIRTIFPGQRLCTILEDNLPAG